MRSLLGFVALFSFALLCGCTKPPAARPEPPPAPVTVTAAVKKTVPIRVRTIGTVKTLATVSIRPRVSGPITEVFFKEGDHVKKNQNLFTIDPRPYEAAVRQAKANKARNEAVLAGAKLVLERLDKIGASGAGAGADADAAATAVATSTAAIKADEIAINTAELQLSFTTITSPIDGVVGELLVDEGNLVDANGVNPLAVINQVNPMTVSFTLPAQQRLVVVEAWKKGPLKVAAFVPDSPPDRPPLATGALSFIDNTADKLTGTVQFKAEFENPNEKLWPEDYLDVVLTLGDRPDSIVVPSAALQSGQKGQYVYVVTADKKAEMRPVKVEFEVDGEAVIASGVNAGETVVVEGQLRLAPGSKVEPKPQPGAPSPPPVPRVVTEGPK